MISFKADEVLVAGVRVVQRFAVGRSDEIVLLTRAEQRGDEALPHVVYRLQIV